MNAASSTVSNSHVKQKDHPESTYMPENKSQHSHYNNNANDGNHDNYNYDNYIDHKQSLDRDHYRN
jgi:hypothetical protein